MGTSRAVGSFSRRAGEAHRAAGVPGPTVLLSPAGAGVAGRKGKGLLRVGGELRTGQDLGEVGWDGGRRRLVQPLTEQNLRASRKGG